MSDAAKYDPESYASLIRRSFGFLETESGMKFHGVRRSGGDDPRDSALVARYSDDEIRLDIGWSEHELSFVILVKFAHADLARAESHVYFEPFVDDLTHRAEPVVVPYITETMGLRDIASVAESRRRIFRHGLPLVAEKLAEKLRSRMAELRSASVDRIRGHHAWLRGRSSS